MGCIARGVHGAEELDVLDHAQLQLGHVVPAVCASAVTRVAHGKAVSTDRLASAPA